MTKNIGLLSSIYWAWRILQNTLLGFMRYIGNYCGTYKIISVPPMRSLKAYFFDKMASPPVKKNTDLWSFYRVWWTPRKNLWESTKFSDNDFASYKFISIGPKRSLKSNFSKKTTFMFTKHFLLLYRILPTMENIEYFFNRLHRVFDQLWCTF